MNDDLKDDLPDLDYEVVLTLARELNKRLDDEPLLEVILVLEIVLGSAICDLDDIEDRRKWVSAVNNYLLGQILIGKDAPDEVVEAGGEGKAN